MLSPKPIDNTAQACARYDEWDRSHSWHPFTQMAEYLSLPQLQVARGDGCWLYDVEGNRYLDGNASIWTNIHGHNDPEINQALKDQIDQVSHSTYLGLSHPNGAQLGRKLAAIAPQGLERVIFSDNGSNAIEIALKLSFQYWQLKGKSEKRLVIGMEDGYHGDTFGAMSAGDSQSFHGRFAPWCFDSLVFPRPIHKESDGRVAKSDSSESLRVLRECLEAQSDTIAAVILEPMLQGAAGMMLQPSGFLKEVETLCRDFDVHLILDEVFVGFGRLGGMLVCSEESVTPDFLCLAKGISAGYLPLAATLTTNSIFETFLGPFDSNRGFFHGHTFSGNPLAAAVALKNLEKLERLLESGRVGKAIDCFGKRVAETFFKHPHVREIRQRGLAAAIDLCPNRKADKSWPINDRVGMQVCLEARKRGLLLRPLMDSILIVPPLVISDEEIDFLMSNLLKAIDCVMKLKENEK